MHYDTTRTRIHEDHDSSQPTMKANRVLYKRHVSSSGSDAGPNGHAARAGDVAGSDLPTPSDPAEITQMLHAIERGDGRASEELLPLVYDELRRHAANRMAHEQTAQTLQPTALVHEAWLRVFGGGHQRWQNRAHFFGAAASAMRRILIENARRKSRLKRGGDQVRVDIEQVHLAATTPDEKMLLIDEALERLEKVDARKARIVELKFFGGFSNQDVAESMGVNERTIERQWAYAKAWLFQTIRSSL